MKAIDTRYNGYRFRSRTEARWAVFMDALGVPYEYEKECFDLESAGLYLPDFWLPQSERWVEIKGQESTPEEREKARALCFYSKKHVVILSGIPGDALAFPPVLIAYADMTEDDASRQVWRRILSHVNEDPEAFGPARYRDENGYAHSLDHTGWFFGKRDDGVYTHSWFVSGSPDACDASAAIAAARSARFEFGETGHSPRETTAQAPRQ